MEETQCQLLIRVNHKAYEEKHIPTASDEWWWGQGCSVDVREELRKKGCQSRAGNHKLEIAMERKRAGGREKSLHGTPQSR